MKRFVLLFRSNPADLDRAMGTPAQAQQSLARWMDWLRDLEAEGALADPGQPLDRSGRVLRSGDQLATDGPYAESKDLVAGFLILRARDLDHASQLASGCPMLAGEGSVEIRPIVEDMF